MRFLVDNQLPTQLSAHLQSLGHTCEHVLDMGLERAEDVDIWQVVTAGAMTLISKDEDFLYLVTRVGDTGRLIWVRLGNCRNAVLLKAFSLNLDTMVQSIEAGQPIIELR